MKNMNENNKAKISGKILDIPVFEREHQGRRYYRTRIETKNYKGVNDVIPLVIQEKFLDIVKEGAFVNVIGEYNSLSIFGEDKKQHLKLFVFANNVKNNEQKSNLNEVYLRGVLAQPPKRRKTRKGKPVTNFLILTQRWNGVTDCIPCIAWNTYADHVTKIKEGREFELYGRIESREYEKDDQKKMAYEISVKFLSIIP